MIVLIYKWVIIILFWINCWDTEFLSFVFYFPFLLNMLDCGQFFALFEASFPLMKTEWRMFESGGDVASVKEVCGVCCYWMVFYASLYFNISLLSIFSSCAFLLHWPLVLLFIWQFDARMVLGDCKAFLDQLFDNDPRRLNANILICIFWRLIDHFISKAPKDLFLVGISIKCDFSLGKFHKGALVGENFHKCTSTLKKDKMVHHILEQMTKR